MYEIFDIVIVVILLMLTAVLVSSSLGPFEMVSQLRRCYSYEKAIELFKSSSFSGLTGHAFFISLGSTLASPPASCVTVGSVS